ncbi:hypothetical protein Nmel_012592 [Mimus melanotis]
MCSSHCLGYCLQSTDAALWSSAVAAALGSLAPGGTALLGCSHKQEVQEECLGCQSGEQQGEVTWTSSMPGVNSSKKADWRKKLDWPGEVLKNGSLQGKGRLVGLNLSGFFSLELWNRRSTADTVLSELQGTDVVRYPIKHSAVQI